MQVLTISYANGSHGVGTPAGGVRTHFPTVHIEYKPSVHFKLKQMPEGNSTYFQITPAEVVADFDTAVVNSTALEAPIAASEGLETHTANCSDYAQQPEHNATS